MELYKELNILENYNLWLFIIGLAILGTAILPRILSEYPLSLPIALFGLGYAAIALPFGLEAPDPLEQGTITEHLTELGVIVALMSAGLKIDRPPGLKRWSITWRLLGITMIFSIGLAALVGWWIAAFVPASAMLLGAVISPTDPVLASEVQISSPGEEEGSHQEQDEIKLEEKDEVRFALTSEAGLNDGLVFPFTNMALAMAMAGAHPQNWIIDWIVVDVLYMLGLAGLLGVTFGYILAQILMSAPADTPLAKALTGLGALAATLLLYGLTEYLGGYGFIATFIGAVTIRNYERSHEFHESLHMFAEKAERLLMAVILIALGAAIAGGLMSPLTWPLIVSAIVIVFLVRPLAGVVGLIGHDEVPWRERLAISFFGIRGIGSLYYLSFALNEHEFTGAEEIWALVALVITISIFIHGFTAAPVINKLDELRQQET